MVADYGIRTVVSAPLEVHSAVLQSAWINELSTISFAVPLLLTKTASGSSPSQLPPAHFAGPTS